MKARRAANAAATIAAAAIANNNPTPAATGTTSTATAAVSATTAAAADDGQLPRNALIQAELARLWAIQDFFNRQPSWKRAMDAIVGKHPWHDLCLVLWPIAAVGVYVIGAKHFWVVALNLLLAFFLNQALEVKKPVEYDPRLRPATNVHIYSYACPSLESYLAVVILGHFCLHYEMAPSVVVLSVWLLGILSFSRIYSRARFPHHIVVSWILGAIGLGLGLFVCEKISFHNMAREVHLPYIVFVCLFVVAYFALAIESNDSQLAYVPKSEFLHVLVGIMNSAYEDPSHSANVGLGAELDPSASAAAAGLGPSAAAALRARQSATSFLNATPRSIALQQAIESSRLGSNSTRRDSFYHLQRTVQRRQEELQSMRTGRLLSTRPAAAESVELRQA